MEGTGLKSGANAHNCVSECQSAIPFALPGASVFGAATTVFVCEYRASVY